MFEVDFDARHGTAKIADEPMIFHCNHYNAFLQRTILDPAYLNCRPALVDAATEVAHAQLSRLFARRGEKGLHARLEMAAALYRFCGFGVLDFSAITEVGGLVSEPYSHYSLAWKNKFGEAQEPMAFFDAGFVAGAVAAAIDAPAGYFSARQLKCTAQGAERNVFEVSLSKERRVYDHQPWSPPAAMPPDRALETSVNEEAIVSALSQMPIVGNEEGLIPAFGVVLTRMYADYYNRISFEFAHALEKATGEKNLGQLLLVEAGHVCAFNTFGGIMKSDEWYGLIHPMLKCREDWVHGMVAVVNALGWGVWRVHELLPNERLVLRIYGGYESNGYLAMYGSSDTPRSYLATGATAGIMNLLYHSDITQKPALTPEFYEATFTASGSFAATQTKCRTMGSGFDEFVAERA